MEGQRLCTGVLQLLMWPLLLSIGVSQTTAESHESLLSCKTNGVFLSLNRALAPLERVTSSNDASGYPATDIYNFGYGEDEYIDTWCTIRALDPDPYIELKLTSPVLITQILFSGTTNTFGLFHTTNLTLEYSPPDNNTILNYYTTEVGDIKYFAAPDLNTLVQLEQPLLTERIRLRPVEWFASDISAISTTVEYICLGVGLYGCLATETATSMGVTSTTIERQSSSPFQSVTTDNSDSEIASQTQTVVRDYQALAIVLPIALLTIAINALLVGVSVYVCVFLRRQKETNRDGKEKVHGYENLEWSSNSNDLTASRYVSTPSKGSISQLLATDHNNAHTSYTSARETGYKAVDHDDMHTIHEAGTAEEEETMLNNLAYGKIVVGGEEEMIGFPKLHGRREEAADDVNLKGNESYNAVSYSPAQDDDKTGYEAVDHNDMHTIHKSGTAEEEETMLDNLAYGKIVVGGEEEMIGFPKLHGQREEAADDVNLKGNESYNAVSYSPAQDDDKTGYEAVDHNDMHTIHESGTAEEEETMLDNLAYGKTVVGGEEEMIGFPKLHGQREEAADDVNLKRNESYNAVSYSPAQNDDKTGYEAVDHDDMHTIHESGTAEEEETMLDNLAYGKIVVGGEEEMIGNESYNTVPYSSAQGDEEEYAYPAFSAIPPA